MIEFIAFFLLGVCAGMVYLFLSSLALHCGAVAIARWRAHRSMRWFYQAIERVM